MDLTKLACYLNSFDKEHPSYDAACYIKYKLGADLKDSSTVNNGDSGDLTDNDITMSTPEQQTMENYEGKTMDGAFKELDVMNYIKDKKEQVDIPQKQDAFSDRSVNLSSEADFGSNIGYPKQASLYSLLKRKFRSQ